MSTHSKHVFWKRPLPSLCVLTAALLSGLLFVPAIHHFADRARAQAMFLPIDRVPYDAEVVVAHAMNYALHSPEANDVVFVGDSTCLCDVAPSTFEKHTGLRAYNLGVPGAIGMNGVSIVTRCYLAHHPRPRLLVLCIEPALLARGQVAEEHLHDRFINVFGADFALHHISWEPRRISENAVLAMRGLFGTVLPVDGDAVMPGPAGMTMNDMLRSLTEQRGYLGWHTVGSQPQMRPTSASPLVALADCQESLETFVQQAKNYGVPVMIRLTPLAQTAALQDISSIINCLQELEKMHNGAVLISRPHVVCYPLEHFGDYRHLRHSGAELFSAFMATEVFKQLSSATRSSTPTTNRAYLRDAEFNIVDAGNATRPETTTASE